MPQSISKIFFFLLLVLSVIPVFAAVEIDDLRQVDGFFCLEGDEPYSGDAFHKENGVVRMKGQITDGLMEGEWRYYNPDGSLYAKGHFVDGDGLNASYLSGVPRNGRDGIWTFYYSNGKKSSEYNYINREKAGVQREWYENGQISHEENVDTGEQTLWYENGRKKYSGFPTRSSYKEWYQSGQLKTVSDPDNALMQEYHSNGKLKSEGGISGSKRHGQWTFYNEKGQITEKAIYDQGTRTGKIQPAGKSAESDSTTLETVISYYDNRLVKEKGYLAGGKRAGIWTFFHWNGKKESEGSFRNGQMEGEWQIWNEDGQLVTREFYLAGQRHGHQFVWNDDGSMKSRGQFKYGKRDGLWIFYLPNGEKQTGFYKDGEKDGRWSYYYADGTELSLFFKNGKPDGSFQERVVE